MRPSRIEVIGSDLAVKWDDGGESFVPLETLRRRCPCAGCQGEADIMGNVLKGPEQELTPRAFQLVRIGEVGSYGIQPFWRDGHSTGIFSFDYLKELAKAS